MSKLMLPAPVRAIAVLRALFLGDLLCSLPALRALRQGFPQAEITLIGLPWASDLVARLPYVDRLLPFPGYPGIAEVRYRPEATRAFLDEARVYGYDLAIQMHGDGRISNGFVAALGARASLGYRHGDDQRLSASLPYQPDEHELLRWLRLVGVATGPQAQLDQRALLPEFPLTADEQARAAALLAAAPGRPLVGLHAGAKDAARRWPPARFAALGDALAEHFGAAVVLTGSAAERPLTAEVRGTMRHPALDLAGATDLGSFAALLSRLDLLVTNDTGASHVAAATYTPSVVLFGPSRPAQWAPLDRARHRVIDALALAGPQADPASALRELPVEAVLAACADMLARETLEVGAARR